MSDLASILAGLDRPNLELVLAAFAHAAGSHEHSDFDLHGGRLLYRRLGPVLDWPADSVQAAS